MSFADPISRKAVLAAIAECDRLGRDSFLVKCGYGRGRNYFLDISGREYDSKAILGVAHGYEYPELGPLSHHAFSGGHLTVKPRLEEIGFVVRVTPKA